MTKVRVSTTGDSVSSGGDMSSVSDMTQSANTLCHNDIECHRQKRNRTQGVVCHLARTPQIVPGRVVWALLHLDVSEEAEMITKDQAVRCDTFHAEGCKRTIGPRGAVREMIEVWRRNGATKTWKTRPEEYRVPVKHGLYAYHAIEPWNAARVHAAEDCPLLKTEGAIG